MAIKVTIDKMMHDENSKTKAYASVETGGVVIHGVRVVDGEKGLFASMPQRAYTDNNGNTKYASVVQPNSKESAADINNAVVGAYEQQLSEEEAATKDDEEVPQPKM